MQFLIDFAKEDKEFRGILERATNYPVVQGVVLDLDRVWLKAWQIRQRKGEAFLSRWIDMWADWPFRLAPRGTWPWLEEFPRHPEIYARPIEWRDIEAWRPLHWDWRQRLAGVGEDGLPLVVKVCLRPQAHGKETIPTVEELKQPQGRLQVEIHAREQAQLSSNPRKQYRPILGGVSIGIAAADFGTLGIILTDKYGAHYALTCSHVAAQGTLVKQPAQRDGSGGSVLGTSIFATTLSTCSSTTPCNPWSGVSAHELDLSLIEIDSTSLGSILEILDIGSLSSVITRSSLSTGQAVEVMGRTTGYSVLQIGGLAVWYKFKRDADYFCFKNLFEIESPYGTVQAIRPGDSGAPVCTADESGKGWCGMVVGCDTFQGYALYSETAEDWLRQNGYTLQVA